MSVLHIDSNYYADIGDFQISLKKLELWELSSVTPPLYVGVLC